LRSQLPADDAAGQEKTTTGKPAVVIFLLSG